MIKYREGYDIDYIRLTELLKEAGWDHGRASDYRGLVNHVESSPAVVTLWDFDYMIGFACLVSGIKGAESQIVLDGEYRGRGFEEELEKRILIHKAK